jgi:hypothetical protein
MRTLTIKIIQVLIAIPTLVATLIAVIGFWILSKLAGLHNEKI